MAASEAPASIEIRAETINQLFDMLDPSPFGPNDRGVHRWLGT
jgi:hypothetical protein